MAKKDTEPKITLERTYIIPLRREWLKVPEYKRANKAVKAIKQFLVRHMKVYDRDTRRVKIDLLLNNELRFRGMRKPPAKIKIKAVKYDNDIVKVELAEIPKIIKYKLDRERRKRLLSEKKIEEETKKKAAEEAARKAAEKKAEKKPEEETKEEVKEKKEKKEAVKEEGLKRAKQEHKRMKHETKMKPVKKPLKRMALEK